METQIFHHAKIYLIFKKKSSKRNQNPSKYHNSITKKYLKPKEELWKLKDFTMQKYNLQKKSFERNQNPSKYHNSITKKYLKAKEELWKLKDFTMQKYNLQKKSSKRNQKSFKIS
jgi:hypothetical protein